nr:hypothetical protein [Microvirga terrestris]
MKPSWLFLRSGGEGSGGKLFNRGIHVRVKGEDAIHPGESEKTADSSSRPRNREATPRAEALEAGDESAKARAVDEVDLAQVENELILPGLDALSHLIFECRSLAGIDPLLFNPDDKNIIA